MDSPVHPPSFLLPKMLGCAIPDGSRHAGLGRCCWTEQMAQSVCVSPFTHQVRTLSRGPQLVTICSRVSVSTALDTRGCCCLSHGLCLPFLIPSSKCMDTLGSQESCQRDHHLPLEHFGSVELDLSVLFSINRAFFLASSGANVRDLWICAKGFGACW